MFTNAHVPPDFIDVELIQNYGISFSNQERKVLNLMLRDGAVTRLTAMHYGIPNVTARIAELRAKLRNHNFDIVVDVKEDAAGNEYGSWSLVDTLIKLPLRYETEAQALAA